MFKEILVFIAFLSVATAGHVAYGGHSNSYRKQDDYGNYHFGYDIVDPYGAKNYRKESGDAWGNKAGSYGLYDVDGRLRIVDYVADKYGFRAKIRTNEPGTTNKDSAAAVYNGPDQAGYSHSHIPAGKIAPQLNYGAGHNHALFGYSPGHGGYANGYKIYGPVHGYGTGHHHSHGHGHGPDHGHGPGHGHGHGHGHEHVYGHGYGHGYSNEHSKNIYGGPIGDYSHQVPYILPFYGFNSLVKK